MKIHEKNRKKRIYFYLEDEVLVMAAAGLRGALLQLRVHEAARTLHNYGAYSVLRDRAADPGVLVGSGSHYKKFIIVKKLNFPYNFD